MHANHAHVQASLFKLVDSFQAQLFNSSSPCLWMLPRSSHYSMAHGSQEPSCCSEQRRTLSCTLQLVGWHHGIRGLGSVVLLKGSCFFIGGAALWYTHATSTQALGQQCSMLQQCNSVCQSD